MVAVPALSGIAIACAAFACIVLFRLGWFLVIIIPVGALLSAAVVGRIYRHNRRLVATFAIGMAILSYGSTFTLLWRTLTNQVSHRTFAMTWHVRDDPSGGRAEVAFEFVDFPGNTIGWYSTALRDHLTASRSSRTDVEFEVQSDAGCVRSFREVRIGDIKDLSNVPHLYGFSSFQGAASPWGPRWWWCP